VTALTNGAADIIPAVLHYYRRFIHGADDAGVVDFSLTAVAIGVLYNENGSIPGAKVGCQCEVGVACSMVAGALCATPGGSPLQTESAAEIGMEHHLGLICDPVGGLIQIPCIERNAIASSKGDQYRANGVTRGWDAFRVTRSDYKDHARHSRGHDDKI
jgi:L-serine dehydratase